MTGLTITNIQSSESLEMIERGTHRALLTIFVWTLLSLLLGAQNTTITI